MRRVSQVAEPTGFGPGDHVCWQHDGPESWRAAAVAFLDEGVHRGERLLYRGTGDESVLLDDLADLPDRDRLLDAGALLLAPGNGITSDEATVEDDRWERAAADAVAAGYRGVRAASDLTTSLLDSAEAHARVARFEAHTERLLARSPIVAMCGYDRRRVDARTRAVASLVHTLRGGTGPEDYCWFTAQGDRWRLSGELDVTFVPPLLDVVAELAPGTGLEVELDGLGFVDIAGVHGLLELASRSAGLVLHDPSPLLCRVVEATVRAVFPRLRIEHHGSTVAVHATGNGQAP